MTPFPKFIPRVGLLYKGTPLFLYQFPPKKIFKISQTMQKYPCINLNIDI
nr:MAG TPA: hypothetical protein [Caudoviricetes sp.]